MNPTRPPTPPAVGLPPAQFAAAFPFHLAMDRRLTLLQVGQTLQKICPEALPGSAFADSFRVLQPEGEWSFEAFKANQRELFLLVHPASKLQLRGQFMLLPDSRVLLFLGSPWFTEASAILDYKLGFDDFAIHDPVVDLLQVLQAQKAALGDAKTLLDRLAAQRAELQKANALLHEQQAETRKLALIAARTDNAVVLTDVEGRTVWVNEGFTRLTGYGPEDVLGRKPGSVLQGPGTDPETVRHIGEQLRKGQGFSVEILNYGKNGRAYWLAVEVQPIHDDQGRLTNFMAIEMDITARRAAQQRLAIQFEVSRLLVEAAGFETAIPQVLQVICETLGWQVGQLWRLEGELLRQAEVWHPPAVQVGGFVAASRATTFARGIGLPGRVWASGQPAWIPDVTRDTNFPRAGIATQEGLHGAFGFPIFVHGGLWGVVEFFSRKIEAPDEALLTTFGAVGNQIGQFIVRRNAEEALRQTNTLQRAILEGAGYAIIAADTRGTIHTFNPAAERMLGYSHAEMVGKQTPALWHDEREVVARAAELTAELGREVKPGFDAFVAKSELGRPDEREWTYIRKDGSRLSVLLSVTTLFNADGQITGYLGIASDLTERKRNEEKLRATLSELERFNRVMLNREARVLELKQEINRVLAEAGRPPAYPSAAEKSGGSNCSP